MKKTLTALIISLSICGCDYALNNTTAPIIIGGISPLSNQGTIFGKMMKNVADLRFSQINAAGGINGRAIQIIWKDGQCDESIATQAALDLINNDNIKIILGGVCSQETLGAGRIANKEHVFLLSPISTSPAISDLGPYSFRTMLPSSTQGKALSQYVNNNSYNKVGLIYDINEYTNPITKTFKELFKGEEIIEEIFSWETKDFRTQIVQLLEKKPNILFINLQSPEILIMLMKELENLNSNIPIITNQVGIDGLTSLQGNKYIEKMKPIGAAFYVNIDSPEFIEFEKQYVEHYGIPLEYKNFAGTTLDAVEALVEALTMSKNVRNPKEIIKKFEQLQLPGISGAIMFNEHGDIRGRNSLIQYDGHEFKIIEREPYSKKNILPKKIDYTGGTS